MKEDLKVACIQCSLLWNDPEGNRSNIAKGIEELEKDIDVAVLPEMFTTGFSMDTFGAESTDDQTTVSWMQQLAKEHNLAITGSIKVEENGQFYNRLYWVDSGQTLQYDKRHLFTFAGEHKTFTAGESLLIVDYKGWRVCPLICYDLRFPKWSRNLDKEGNSKYDLLIYVANWPGVRSTPWEVLLRARAIENQCYLVGCNRVGTDNNGIGYSGNSCLLNAKGEDLSIADAGEDKTLVAGLSWKELQDFREKFPVLSDGDTEI